MYRMGIRIGPVSRHIYYTVEKRILWIFWYTIPGCGWFDSIQEAEEVAKLLARPPLFRRDLF